MNNFQGDINKTRELLSQAVQYLEHVNNANHNGQPSISATSTSGSSTYHRSAATDDRPSSSMTTSTGRNFGNHGSPYTVAECRALFRPNQYMWPTFNPSRPLKKRNKIALWKHNFICLANTYDDLVPSNIAKANLIRAGLGLKEITFSLNGDSSDFHEEILNAFPKLRDSGGYELLRTSDGHSKLLHVIPPLSGGYTAAYLKSIMAQSKVYLRPLQQDLSMEPITSNEHEVCIIKLASY